MLFVGLVMLAQKAGKRAELAAVQADFYFAFHAGCHGNTKGSVLRLAGFGQQDGLGLPRRNGFRVEKIAASLIPSKGIALVKRVIIVGRRIEIAQESRGVNG